MLFCQKPPNAWESVSFHKKLLASKTDFVFLFSFLKSYFLVLSFGEVARNVFVEAKNPSFCFVFRCSDLKHFNFFGFSNFTLENLFPQKKIISYIQKV